MTRRKNFDEIAENREKMLKNPQKSPEIAKIDRNRQKWPKLKEIVKNGQKLTKIARNRSDVRFGHGVFETRKGIAFDE